MLRDLANCFASAIAKNLNEETSQFHFPTIRKNIFLWVEECYRLSSSVDQGSWCLRTCRPCTRRAGESSAAFFATIPKTKNTAAKPVPRNSERIQSVLVNSLIVCLPTKNNKPAITNRTWLVPLSDGFTGTILRFRVGETSPLRWFRQSPCCCYFK